MSLNSHGRVLLISSQHHYALRNPHVAYHRLFQQRFSLNVWADAVGDHLVGLHVFEENLNGNIFLNFLQHQFHVLPNEIPTDSNKLTSSFSMMVLLLITQLLSVTL